MRTSALLAVLSLLGACGGSDVEPESPASTAASDTGSAPAAAGDSHDNHMHAEGGHKHDFPPRVHDFHEALSPLWHGEPGPERMSKTCAAVPVLGSKAWPLENAAPESVDASMWQTKATDVTLKVKSLAATCQGESLAEFEASFKAVHDAFHAMIALLPGDEH